MSSSVVSPVAGASTAPSQCADPYAAIADQKPIRWGLLGTGKIAEDFANALHPCADVVLQAIGSRALASATAFGALFAIPSRYGSYAALVGDPEVDVVYISTPDRFHAEHARLALEAGKHVLVEKPFTATPEEAAEVFALARAKGLFAMEAMWTRFTPAMVHALDLIRSGAIGRVRLIASDFGCPFPIPSGALNALGVYDLALQQMVVDAAEEGQQQQQQQQPGADAKEQDKQGLAQSPPPSSPAIPSQFRALAIYDATGQVDQQVSCQSVYGRQQVTATFTASLLCDSHKEALIVGTTGRLRLLGPLWHSTDRLVVELTDDPTAAAGGRVIDFSGREARAFVRPFNLLNSERLVYEALEVHRCVRASAIESPRWTHAQTQQVMTLMHEVRNQTSNQLHPL